MTILWASGQCWVMTGSCDWRSYYPKPKSFNVVEQLAALARLYPGSDGKVRGDELVFQAEMKPTTFSRAYLVRVSYREGHFPETVVLNPKLRSLAGERKLPHVYRGDMDPLCLFYAKGREWTPQQMIANTISLGPANGFFTLRRGFIRMSWKVVGLNMVRHRLARRRRFSWMMTQGAKELAVLRQI